MKLATVTVDDNGKETFVMGGSLDQIQKERKFTTLLLQVLYPILPTMCFFS